MKSILFAIQNNNDTEVKVPVFGCWNSEESGFNIPEGVLIDFPNSNHLEVIKKTKDVFCVNGRVSLAEGLLGGNPKYKSECFGSSERIRLHVMDAGSNHTMRDISSNDLRTLSFTIDFYTELIFTVPAKGSLIVYLKGDFLNNNPE